MPRDFWRLTFFELSCLINNQDQKSLEMWSIARFNATASLNSNPYLKKPYKQTDIMKLPNDKIISEPMKKDDFKKNISSLKKSMPFNIA